METIYIPISELRVGKVISEDIFANTQYPIIFKNTIITHEHLPVFLLLIYREFQFIKMV